MSAAVSTFPERVHLSGKLAFDSFVDVYGRAPAVRTPRRSGDALSRHLNRPSTPAPSAKPFSPMPLPMGVLSLEEAYGVLDKVEKVVMRWDNASAIQKHACSQDLARLQSLLALRSSQDAPAIPTMRPLYHKSAVKVEFSHQDNELEGLQASAFSESTAPLPSSPAQRQSPAPDNLWELMPMALERSLALRYYPEELWDAGSHHLDTTKPLRKNPLEKTRAALYRIRHKLSRSKA